MPNSELHRLISDLSISGEADSPGAFTISPEQAREKLSQFALFQTRQYVVNVVASAVAGGASTIKVRTAPCRVAFDYDGEPLSEHDLHSLWNQLLSPTSPRLHELAMALNAARRLSTQMILVESWSEGDLWRLEVVGDELRVSRSDEPGEGTKVTVVESSWSNPRAWLFGPSEDLFLLGVTYLGPSQLMLNDRSLRRNVRLGHSPGCAAWRHLTPAAPEASRLRVEQPDPLVAPLCASDVADSGSSLEAVITLGSTEECQRERLLLLCHGIAVPRPAVALGYTFASAVVVAKGLRKNLSHSDLVEDETYARLLEELRFQVEELIVSRLDDPRPLPDSVAHPLYAQADELKRRLGDRRLDEARKVVDRWLHEVHFARDVANEGLWAKVSHELSLLEGEPAAAMETRLAGKLREVGQAFFRTGKTQQAAACWERLLQLGRMRKAAWVGAESQVRDRLRLACGIVDELTTGLEGYQRALMERMSGHPERATALSSEPLHWAEALLALRQEEEAELLLREILKREKSPEAAEHLSDLLAFSHQPAIRDRAEALVWREKSLGWRVASWPGLETMMLTDVAQLARSVSTASWIRHEARLAMSSLAQPLAELNRQLDRARDRLRRQKLATPTLKALVLATEARWGPASAVAQLALTRAVHMLREAGQWREADDLLARGHLVQRLCGDWDTPTSG